MTEGFIEAVREFPCLWNVTSKSFKDVHAKENAWKAIAEKVNSLLGGIVAYDLMFCFFA